MLNPMTWSIPLFRLFGVQVRLHLLFILITLGLFVREVTREGAFVAPLDVFAFTVLMLFGIILIHEFGHVFGARSVGGDCDEVLLWPLGGLAYCSVPDDPRSNFITSAGGPLTNLVQCLAAAAILAVAGFVPSVIPWDSPYIAPMYNFKDGRVYTGVYGLKLYEAGTATPLSETGKKHLAYKSEDAQVRAASLPMAERALAPTWAVWVDRWYWLNAVLLLINLLPAFPLDGGQMLQALLWPRMGYRQATLVACLAGYGTAMAMLVTSLIVESTTLVMLMVFIGLTCYMKLRAFQEGGEYEPGYGGGGSLNEDGDADEAPRKRAKQVGLYKRWQQNRTAKRLQREHVQRTRDDERMDSLLEKIASKGKESLTAEERSFMTRVSERYRK